MSKKIIVVVFAALFSNYSLAYEKLEMRIESKNGKTLSSKLVGEIVSTISTPNNSWSCEGIRTTGYHKVFRQDLVGIFAKCKSGKAFFTREITCATQPSYLGSNAGLDVMGIFEIELGDEANRYVLLLTCSTISPEKLDAEIEAIKKGKR